MAQDLPQRPAEGAVEFRRRQQYGQRAHAHKGQRDLERSPGRQKGVAAVGRKVPGGIGHLLFGQPHNALREDKARGFAMRPGVAQRSLGAVGQVAALLFGQHIGLLIQRAA